MKNLSRFLALLALTAFASAPTALRAQDAPPPPDQGMAPPPDQGAPPPDQGDASDDQGASFQQFYDQLGSQGQWIQTDNYGYVFQPTVSDPDWAPYTDGHWVYTDVGWTWVSDEPWGWATYHYGRWANIDGTGWVWVPGYRWAPAWVSWRYGGGYAGWAPLPPETFVGVEFGGGGGWSQFHFGSDVDVSFGIGAGYYNFVNVGYLGDPNYRGHYLDRNRNYTVINNTRNVTNITVNNNYYGGAGGNFRNVNTGGPTLAEVNAQAHTRVQTVQLTSANHAGRSSLEGNSLAVYAPRVNATTVHSARPAQVSQTIAHPTLNRGTSIAKPLQVNRQFKPTAPSAEAIAAAKAARAAAPASARIATSSTHMTTTISKPLTSMAPVAQSHTAANSLQKPAASSVYHPGENAYTGEGQKPASPSVSHAAENPAYTGEAEKPASTYHPAEAPGSGGQVYHPESQFKPTPTAGSSGQVYHPSTEEKPAATYHPESAPASTYHPQTEEKPAAAFHPQTEEKPAPTFHPQAEPQHAAQAPASHPQGAAPAAKPAASGGGGNKEEPKGAANPQGH